MCAYFVAQGSLSKSLISSRGLSRSHDESDVEERSRASLFPPPCTGRAGVSHTAQDARALTLHVTAGMCGGGGNSKENKGRSPTGSRDVLQQEVGTFSNRILLGQLTV